MADILQEVLNDAQDEKRILIFRRILPIIIILTLIIAGTISGWSWYQHKIEQQYERTGDLLLDIINQTDSADILQDFIQNNDNRQLEIARLFEIIQLTKLEQPSSEQQVALYEKLEQIIAEKSFHEITKSYANLLWLNLILGENHLSDQQKSRARDHMQYFAQEDQLFFANATILKSLFYQKIEQYDLAVQQAELVLNMPKTSSLLKDQAKAIIANVKYYMLD